MGEGVVLEEVFDLLLSVGDDLFDFLMILLGVVLEGGSNGASDHGLELLLLLNFIPIISNYIINKEYLV